jgi:hypothetical protein
VVDQFTVTERSALMARIHGQLNSTHKKHTGKTEMITASVLLTWTEALESSWGATPRSFLMNPPACGQQRVPFFAGPLFARAKPIDFKNSE